jgi:hypothetical protein
MQTLGYILQVCGIVLMVAGYIWAIVYCFRQGIVLGLLCLFLGLAVLIYLFVCGERGAFAPGALTYSGMLIILVGSELAKG